MVNSAEHIDSKLYNWIHFIGIGGISMSGLAEILHRGGAKVTGSDTAATRLTEHLQSIGIDITIGQRAENIAQGIELVVYTAAVKDENPELAAARAAKKPTMERAEFLGLMMKDYEYPICVSGTHGKTTTTSMIAEIFMAANADPTISVGGILASIGSNFRVGGHRYFIAEACEYFDSFLKFCPNIGLILNIEMDHVDYFRDFEQMLGSYRAFAARIPAGGALVIDAEIPDFERITSGLSCRVLAYGTRESGVYADDVVFDENGCGKFTMHAYGQSRCVELKVPGAHNIRNALAAGCAAYALGIDADSVTYGLSRFGGTARRFEYKGSFRGASVVDDYAHHPTEIRATLAAAKKTKAERVLCVFQPHTYSRTKDLLNELAASFDNADEVLLVDIYAAREKDPGSIHSRDVAKKITENGTCAKYFSSFENVEKYLSESCIPNDLLITMGAGDVYFIGDRLLSS